MCVAHNLKKCVNDLYGVKKIEVTLKKSIQMKYIF
jgi:copper chaperone CopZ